MNENEDEKRLPEATTSFTNPTKRYSSTQASTDSETPVTSGSTSEITTDTKTAPTTSSTTLAKKDSATESSIHKEIPVAVDSETPATTDSTANTTTDSETDLIATTQEKISSDTSESNLHEVERSEKLADGVPSNDTDTFTVDDVVNSGGYGKFQKFLTFLAGLGWLADAFEIIILSIIGDMLACDWVITRWMNALLTSIVFFGMVFGAPFFGKIADRYGRRMTLAISMLFLFIFGAASSASPSYTWMIVLRGLMGFALGGIAQGVTLCCEYYPANVRGRAGFYLSYYWAIGTLGVVLSAWVVMRYLDDWRVFIFIAAIPALIVFLVMKWYPESARYYLVSNQPEKALAVLERLVRMNKAEMPSGTLLEMDAAEERGQLMDLLKPTLRRSTLQFWYIWLTVAMLYYGIALLTPLIVTHGSLMELSRLQGNRTFAEDFTAIVPCKKYTDENFIELLWTSAAEFPGLLVFSLTVECCSRKIFLGTTIIINSFLLLMLMLEIRPRIALLLILFVARAVITGIFQLLFIMTTEAFPTTLRASAMGTGSAMARIGGVIVPIVAQVIIISKPVAAISTLFFFGILAGISAFLLPLETRGRNMQEVIAQF